MAPILLCISSARTVAMIVPEAIAASCCRAWVTDW